MEKKEIIKQFLESIKDDILYIDGGCSQCIAEFTDGVNEKIESMGLKIEYEAYKSLKVVEIKKK